MNIDDCIEVLWADKAGRKIQCRNVLDNGIWGSKGANLRFNFHNFDYRIAPDVVYKIEHHDGNGGDAEITYMTVIPSACKYTKGYWVEGEPS